MTKPVLGTMPDGGAVAVDIDRLIQSRLLVQGASGSRKTTLVKRLLEQTHGKVQQIVLDVEDEYASLRERFDYVLAGPGRDCPAEPRSAALLARRLLELGSSAIINVHDMKAHDRIRFVRLFVEGLMEAPQSLWHDVLVVGEELQVFAPQAGREAESTAALIDLASRGRKRGFCLVAVTQRISDLHKSIVAQCGNRLIGRTTLDTDVKRAAYELGFAGRDEARQLVTLPSGSFFAFGPALSEQVVLMKTGELVTPYAVKRGAKATAAPPAPEKVRAILSKLADLPKEAETEAKNAEELRARVKQLEREARAKPAAITLATSNGADLKAARAETAAWKRAHADLARTAGKVTPALTLLRDNSQRDAGKILAVLGDACTASAPSPQELAASVGQQARQDLARTVRVIGDTVTVNSGRRYAANQESGSRSAPAADGGLSGPEQRILDGLAWLEGVGVAIAEQSAAAFMAGYTLNGSFFNARGALHKKELVEYLDGSRLRLTDEGRKVATPLDVPATAEALQQQVLSRLPGPEQRILKPLLEAYPNVVSNEELAPAAGYTLNGSYFNARGRLRALGLVEYRGGGVVALPLLFLEGAA